MSKGRYKLSADFVSPGARELFVLSLEPESQSSIRTVFFVHAFAEELNKSRHLVFRQAIALAERGYRVILPDLSGCGDSSGVLREACWDDWKADIDSVLEHYGNGASSILWGLRLGALLACEIAQHRPGLAGLLLWQPVINGEQHIDQFLRIESAGRALAGVKGFDRSSMWNSLRGGDSLSVAGYELSPELVNSIASRRLADLRPACPVNWFDIGTANREGPKPAALKVMERWEKEAGAVNWLAVKGASFWSEIDSPINLPLLQVTLDELDKL